MTSLYTESERFIAKTPGRSKAPTDRALEHVPLACVMVSYRTGPILFVALEALLRQSQPPAEVVLVDNGNPPEVEQALDDYAAAHPQVRIERGQGNIGFAAACNLGASLTESPRLLFLNPDCLLPESALERLAAEFADLPPRSLLSPLLINDDFTEQRGSRRSVLTPWRAVVEWLGLYRLAPSHPYFRRFNRSHDPLPLHTHAVDVTSGAAMLMQRTLLEELRGFDERYFLHVEDVDLCVTLLKRGGSAHVAPSVRVMHHASSSDSARVKVEWHKARGFCRYFRKQFSGVYPPGFLTVVNLLVWCRFLLRTPLLMLQRRKSPPFTLAGAIDVRPNASD